MSEWIPVKVRFPETDFQDNSCRFTESVQATDGETVYVGWFVVFKWDNSFYFQGRDIRGLYMPDSRIEDITHWAPFLEPTEVHHE